MYLVKPRPDWSEATSYRSNTASTVSNDAVTTVSSLVSHSSSTACLAGMERIAAHSARCTTDTRYLQQTAAELSGRPHTGRIFCLFRPSQAPASSRSRRELLPRMAIAISRKCNAPSTDVEWCAVLLGIPPRYCC